MYANGSGSYKYVSRTLTAKVKYKNKKKKDQNKYSTYKVQTCKVSESTDISEPFAFVTYIRHYYIFNDVASVYVCVRVRPCVYVCVRTSIHVYMYFQYTLNHQSKRWPRPRVPLFAGIHISTRASATEQRQFNPIFFVGSSRRLNTSDSTLANKVFFSFFSFLSPRSYKRSEY